MINNDLIVTASDTSPAAVMDHPGLIKALVAVLTLSFVACLAVMAVLSLFPPAVASNVSVSEFSAARAREFLDPIAQKPPPIGSAAHAEVRDYISGELTRLRLQSQVQRTTAVNTF